DVIVGYSNFSLVSNGGVLLKVAGPGDAIYGGDGGDTISGDGDSDLISGGSGADLFVFPGASHGSVVTDFQRGDHLALTSGPVSEADYGENIAASLEERFAGVFALGEINAGRKNVMVVQVGPDLHVYADIRGTNVVNLDFTLRNTDLSAIDASNFVGIPS